MAAHERFEDLQVWQAARTLVREIYLCTQSGSFAKDLGLKTQIQRAAVSIMSNIAEGFERSGNKEFSHFLYLAKGSAGEVRSQLYIAFDLGYLDQKTFGFLNDAALSISKQLSGFIKYLNRSLPSKATRQPERKQFDNLKI
jgi:four helix bundle protein